MKKYILIFAAVGIFITASQSRAEINEVRDIVFPVDGEVSYKDDYDQPRSGGLHEATDLIGEKHLPLLAAVDGVVVFQPIPEPSWGYGIWIRDAEGYEYVYLHINNDTPGTDDNQADLRYVFAPDVRKGSQVKAGQVIAYMGDSGNAENITSHLHFEIHDPQGNPINPYYSLLASEKSGSSSGTSFNAGLISKSAESISIDKDLVINSDSVCTVDSLFKGQSSSTVYYCGRDGKRYFFPNDKVFFSWYKDFSGVQTVSDAELTSVPLGGNVTYKPGFSLVKIQSDPKVYAVDSGGVLRHISSAQMAVSIFGDNWQSLLHDVDVAYFVNYRVGDPL